MDSDSSEVKGHVTLYGKVVKSIQRSIRRIFQCGKDKTESLGSVQTSDCFAGPSNQASLNQASLNQASLNQASSKQMLSLDSSSSQIDVSMTSIHPLNSPITSVSPDEVSQVAPIHKTLLIDVSYSKPLLSTPLECDVGRKCLVLDLDETLVHSTFQPVVNADLIVPVHLGEGIFQPIYVCKRPGVDEFLREVSKHFEVVLFTASLPNYADPVIDFLDPYCGIRCRLYREDCLQFQGMYIKDLSRLGRDIDQVIIVDNSPASYSMHPQNALGCKSWFRDAHDRELADRILPMLMRLKDSSCVSQWRTENLELINTPYY